MVVNLPLLTHPPVLETANPPSAPRLGRPQRIQIQLIVARTTSPLVLTPLVSSVSAWLPLTMVGMFRRLLLAKTMGILFLLFVTIRLLVLTSPPTSLTLKTCPGSGDGMIRWQLWLVLLINAQFPLPLTVLVRLPAQKLLIGPAGPLKVRLPGLMVIRAITAIMPPPT